MFETLKGPYIFRHYETVQILIFRSFLFENFLMAPKMILDLMNMFQTEKTPI